MLEAAVWAPNHHMTEPWDFIVLTGSAKRRFAELSIPVIIAVTTTAPAVHQQDGLAKLAGAFIAKEFTRWD